MNKRLVCILILLCLLALGATAEQVYIRLTLAEMERVTLAVQSRISEEDEVLATPQNVADVAYLSSFWARHRDGYEIFLSHTYAIELENKISVLDTHLLQDDYLMTSTDLEGILASLDLIRDAVTPALHMIL